MFGYWAMLFPFAFFAMFERKKIDRFERPLSASLITTALILTLLIGFRYQVGGDWFSYLRIFYQSRDMGLTDFMEAGSDPGYGLLNSLSHKFGWGIIGVNVISAAIFSFGLLIFCSQQSRPWLALLVSIPYLVIVVAMGYTRQSVAIGFAMMGLAALGKQSNLRFVISIILATTFHKSAALLMPIAALSSTNNRLWSVIWIAIVSIVTYLLFLEQSADLLVKNYVEAKMQSEGAFVRVAMNALPAIAYLLLKKDFDITDRERRLWTILSGVALIAMAAYFLLQASTAVDRVSLYLIPIQLFVLSRLPDVFYQRGLNVHITIFGIFIYCALVLYVWLNYAVHAHMWLPYRIYFL